MSSPLYTLKRNESLLKMNKGNISVQNRKDIILKKILILQVNYNEPYFDIYATN